MDLALNNLQWLICHQTKSNAVQPPNQIHDMTLNNPMVRLQSWSSGECEVHLHYHFSQVVSDPEWLHLIVLSIGQIELFKPCANKRHVKLNCYK